MIKKRALFLLIVYIVLTIATFEYILVKGRTFTITSNLPNQVSSIDEINIQVEQDNDSIEILEQKIVDDKIKVTVVGKEVGNADELPFGNKTIKVIETPGHTKGGVCYLFEDMLFTGDTIMTGTTGRMDLPTGNTRDMINSVRLIAGLEGDLRLFCGHGNATTLDYERKHNYVMEYYINVQRQ